jgi:hypothetical protein
MWEHLHPDCRLAVFDEIPIRHLIRPSFRHASKERFEAGPHLPKLTKGQRFDAPDLTQEISVPALPPLEPVGRAVAKMLEPEPAPAAGRAAPEHCFRGDRSSGYWVPPLTFQFFLMGVI